MLWKVKRTAIDGTLFQEIIGGCKDLQKTKSNFGPIHAGMLETTNHPWKIVGRNLRINNALSTSTTRGFQRELIESALEYGKLL